ncbi:hypothetical protein L1887_10715 [Cichorium endivia]|nr:hypothetical protein L1887_10715 [Cichorium endivia]
MGDGGWVGLRVSLSKTMFDSVFQFQLLVVGGVAFSVLFVFALSLSCYFKITKQKKTKSCTSACFSEIYPTLGRKQVSQKGRQNNKDKELTRRELSSPTLLPSVHFLYRAHKTLAGALVAHHSLPLSE